MPFSTCRPEKTLHILEPHLASGTISVSRRIHNIRRRTVDAVTWWTLVVKCHGVNFYDFCSAFFLFFSFFIIQPTGGNYPQIRTISSSNYVFCFVRCLFGLRILHVYLMGVYCPKTLNFGLVFVL